MIEKRAMIIKNVTVMMCTEAWSIVAGRPAASLCFDFNHSVKCQDKRYGFSAEHPDCIRMIWWTGSSSLWMQKEDVGYIVCTTGYL